MMAPNKGPTSRMLVLSMDASTKELKTGRVRATRACNLCRLKKKKCDGKHPCSFCQAFGNRECVYQDRKSARLLRRKPQDSTLPRGVLEELPDKDIALQLIHKTWDNVCVLFRFLYRPSIVEVLTSLYDSKDAKNLTERQLKSLPLIYSVIAVGALFGKEDLEKSDVVTRDLYQEAGYKYFKMAKCLIDVTNLGDIYAIQTMFMLTMFLQCSANLNTCYSYTGIALRAAISEGLHRKNSCVGPTAIEDETKKRLFWSVYKVDLYMGCILGLPRALSEAAVNQELPCDVDDEKITSGGILEQEWGKISSCGMNNQHTKLMLVMARIHESLYPVLTWNQATYINIMTLEQQLETWLQDLPFQLKPNYTFFDESERAYYLKPTKLLYLDYLLAKIILYKPFIHYLAIDSPLFDFQISMANKCIQVAHEVINLSREMLEEDLLSGSYWFSIHTIFFSVTCLMFYQHQINLGLIKEKGINVTEDCERGVEILMKLKNSSPVGERSFKVLNSIFKEFNKKTMELYAQVNESVRQLMKDPAGQVENENNSDFPPQSEQDEILEQLLEDFEIPFSNILPDFQMTSFFPTNSSNQVPEKVGL